MPVKIETFVVGPLETNCYVLQAGNGSGDGCWIIDPGWADRSLMDFLRDRQLSPSRVLLTHGHGDHIAGVGAIRDAYPNVRICCAKLDSHMLIDPVANMSAVMGVPMISPAADELLSPSEVLTCGLTTWTVVDTSGHTPGGVSYYCEQVGVVFAGDALFRGSVGRTDLPGGSFARLIKMIAVNLMTLPDETRVLSGHGEPTTIGHERLTNPFHKEYWKGRL